MQVFVLGAGLGTRLRPLTDDLPKPLVPIFQKPLITFAFDHLLAETEARAFHVNTHHLPEKFAELFPHLRYREANLQFYHEPILLETAGGIANVVVAPDEPLLVYNADILTDLPLAPLLKAHHDGANFITLALRSSGPSQHIALEGDRVVDVHNLLGTGAPERFLFTGIYVVSPAFRARLERGVKCSVIPHFLDAIRRGDRVGGVVIDQGNWWDVGTPAAYRELHRVLPTCEFPRFPVIDREWRAPVHGSAKIAPDAAVSSSSVIGANVVVEKAAILAESIVWSGAQIAPSSNLQKCIVRTARRVSGTHGDAII